MKQSKLCGHHFSISQNLGNLKRTVLLQYELPSEFWKRVVKSKKIDNYWIHRLPISVSSFFHYWFWLNQVLYQRYFCECLWCSWHIDNVTYRRFWIDFFSLWCIAFSSMWICWRPNIYLFLKTGCWWEGSLPQQI